MLEFKGTIVYITSDTIVAIRQSRLTISWRHLAIQIDLKSHIATETS